MSIALLCIDLMNDLIDPKGKLADAGYVDFEKRHDVLQRIARTQEHFREQGGLVIHSRTVFSPNHFEVHPTSRYLKEVKEKEALVMDEWGTEHPEIIAPRKGEPVINKHRFDPFYRTRLEIVLRSQDVKELYVCGLSTLGSISQCAVAGHDRDFKTVIIKDCCLDKSDSRHERGLDFISEITEVKDFNEIALRITEHADDGMRRF